MLNKKDIVNSILLAISNILLFIGISFYLQGHIEQYAMFIGFTGVLIYMFQDRIKKTFENKYNPFVRKMLETVVLVAAYTLLFISLKFYLNQFVVGNAVWYIIGGLLVYAFHGKITRWIVKE